MKNIIKLLLLLSKKTRIKLYYFLIILVFASIIDAISVTALSPLLEILTNKDNTYEIPIIYQSIIENSFLYNLNTLLSSLIIFITLIIFSSLIRLYNLYFAMNMTKSISVEISTNLFHKNIYQKYEDYIYSNSNKSINLNTREVERFTESLGGLFNVIVSITISIAIIIALTILNPIITWSLISTITLGYFIITKYTSSKFKLNDRLISKHGKTQIKLLQESSFGFIEMLLSSSQTKAIKNFRENEYILKSKITENQFLSLSPKYILEPILIVSGTLIIYFLVTNELNNINKIISSLGVIALGGQKILPVFNQVYGGISSIKSNETAVNSILKILTKKDLYIKETSHSKIKKRNPEIPNNEFIKMQLSNIFFSFRDGTQLIKNINLEIKKGEKIGIVGTTGSGKSSLVNIMMGLLEPSSGKIVFNDKIICPSKQANINIKYLQSKISYVPQDIFLKEGSLAENIAYGDENYKNKFKEIKEIALVAQLGELIEGSRDGLSIQVGERGMNLSGGQKQRVGIARSIFKKCELLFLDEATSALDNKTESKLMFDICKNFPNLTIVSIAHRIQSIKNFDKIYVLKGGEIIDSGTYSNLVKTSFYFKNLIQYEPNS